jgi:hypothetical protein
MPRAIEVPDATLRRIEQAGSMASKPSTSFSSRNARSAKTGG